MIDVKNPGGGRYSIFQIGQGVLGVSMVNTRSMGVEFEEVKSQC